MTIIQEKNLNIYIKTTNIKHFLKTEGDTRYINIDIIWFKINYLLLGFSTELNTKIKIK